VTTSNNVVIVTGGKGEKGDPGSVEDVAHAMLPDRATSGHPASIIAADGPASWTTVQEALDGLHALATALDPTGALDDLSTALADLETALTAADTAEATTRANADTAEVTARNTAISTAINNLIDSAPGTLDTLGEIATALADNDNAVAALTTAINARAAQTDLTAEVARATTAEADLAGDLTAEVTRATTAEGALNSAIADRALQTALTAETTARTTAITTAVNNLIDSAPGTLDTLGEIAAALANDADAVTALTTAVNARALQTDLTAEVSRATLAEEDLSDSFQGFIDIVNENWLPAKADLTALTAETSRATTAEETLTGDLDIVENRLDVLASGEMVPQDRRIALVVNNTGTMVSGRLHLHYFTAERTEAISQIETYSGATAAGATPTLIRLGIYSIDTVTGDGTLVASIANDLTLYVATFTTYLRSLTSTFSKVRGARYAIGTLVVTAAAAPIVMTMQTGTVSTADTLLARAPRIGGRLDSQTDLPASFLGSAIQTNRILPSTRLVV
jgi:hypothetical protein